MEAEQHHYELRSRSRSRSETPQVLSREIQESESMEHHYSLRSKSRERSLTPGHINSRRSSSKSLPVSTTKVSDKNMEPIVEQKEEVVPLEASSENKSHLQDSSSASAKKIERRSERQRVRRQIFANGQSEVKENIVNSKLERKRKSVTPKRTLTSDYSSEEGERDDPPKRPGSAYEIYKKAGEWWNVFPKTDYTYSRHSQCRYEIAPGILAMPNMSRCSIHSDSSSTLGSGGSFSQQSLNPSQTVDSLTGSFVDTTDTGDINQQDLMFLDRDSRLSSSSHKTESGAHTTMYKTTHVEHYKTRREVIYADSGNPYPEIKGGSYTWRNNSLVESLNRKLGRVTQLDSDAELDEAVTVRTRIDKKWKITEWIQETTRTWFFKVLEVVGLREGRSKRYDINHDYRTYQESRWTKVRKPVDRMLQYVYLLLMKIILWDSWLLNRASSVRERIHNQHPKILWLLMLPPILLAGWWFLPSVLSALPFPSIGKVLEPVIKDVGINTVRSVRNDSTERSSFRDDDLNVLVQLLADRIQKLEAGSQRQAEILTNVSRIADVLEENSKNVWTLYNNKLTDLGEKLEEKITSQDKADEIRAIKFELESLREDYSQLKSCCKDSALTLAEKDVEKYLEQSVSGYFASASAKDEITNLVKNILSEQRDAQALKDKEVQEKYGSQSVANLGTGFAEAEMRRIVKETLKIYDADKTGKADYALESAGGQIISTRCTQPYDIGTRVYKFLGYTIYYGSNDPRTVIQGNPLQPGVCWAFQDFPGHLLIKLRSFIYVTGFTLEHVPKSLLPSGEMKSAPRKFNVWGFRYETDPDPVMLGDYEFVDSDESLQYFPAKEMEFSVPYEYVELKIHSNHGQLEYTCLYRFRVHGIPVSKP
ncbi:uncharacterized protein LOC105700101 isoform X2 [Orussus abietinus]|uniref:uncharacterized protein LOC105700101 isoform X2 n=1 Tax=Orussus abietinus TaxID=222816 RepID=UPI000625F561|nr:uncharacterized protein LOC105700101 isoform X2 [Orussus abietinus]